MVKVFTILKKRGDLTRDEFSNYWREKHGPLILEAMPGIRRYVQNHAITLPGKSEGGMDGMAEIWYDDLSTWKKGSSLYLGSGGEAIRRDEDKFIDRDKMSFFVADEIIIKG